VAGEEQDDEHRRELVVAQALVLLGVQQRRDEVGAAGRVGAMALDDRPDERPELQDRGMRVEDERRVRAAARAARRRCG
jgi:hypothetical protein